MKTPIILPLSLLLAAALASADDGACWTGTAEGTVAEHVADGATTAAGLALGAAEFPGYTCAPNPRSPQIESKQATN